MSTRRIPERGSRTVGAEYSATRFRVFSGRFLEGDSRTVVDAKYSGYSLPVSSRRLPEEGPGTVDQEFDRFSVRARPRTPSLSLPTWYPVRLGQGPSRMTSSGLSTTVID